MYRSEYFSRPLWIEKRQPIDLVMDPSEVAEEAELCGRIVAGADEIDHVTTVSQARRLLDDDRRVTGPAKGHRQGQSSDSCSDDRDAHGLTPISSTPFGTARSTGRSPARAVADSRAWYARSTAR